MSASTELSDPLEYERWKSPLMVEPENVGWRSLGEAFGDSELGPWESVIVAMAELL